MSETIRFSSEAQAGVLSKPLRECVYFRPLVKDDLSSLEWEGEYTHFRRLYQRVYQSMKKGDAQMWVADLPGKGVIGQVFVQLSGERKELADGITRAYLYSFRVRPLYRSLGIGSLLLQTVEKDILERRFCWLTLNVGRDNPAARRFYERHDYKIAAPEPGKWSYLDHRGIRQYVNEPAWRMQKNLHNSLDFSGRMDVNNKLD